MIMIKKYFPFIVIICYVLICLIGLGALAVQYDEIPHVNAAIGAIDTLFIIKTFEGVPILLMPYIGALKSYIAAPVFFIFDVNPYSIRVPFILICSLGLLILYKLIQNYFDNRMAVLTLILIAFDSSFISQTRVDMGPLVLDFFCKVFSIFLFFYYLKNKRSIYLLLIWITLFAGLFHKLNFIWFINSFGFASFVVYFNEIKKVWKTLEPSRKVLLAFFPIFTIATLFGYYLYISTEYKLSSGLLPKDWDAKLINYTNNFKLLIDGRSFYEYALGSINSNIVTIYFYFLVAIIVMGLILLMLKFKELDNKFKKSYLFIFTIFFTLALQILITAQATANWHMFALYPFITILIAGGIVMLAELRFTTIKIYKLNFQTIIYSLILVTILTYQTWMYSNYIAAYHKPPKNITWSSQIYPLIDYTKQTESQFVSIDWGIHNQLIVFTQIRGKYSELAFFLSDPQLSKPQKTWLYEEFFNQKGKYQFITRTEEGTSFTKSRKVFFDIVEEYSVELKKVKEFKDSDGRIVFEVYSI